MKVLRSSMGLGALTAIASSLCCIVPLLTIFAGASGLASTFKWIEPLRPWLIGLTLLALGFAWYQMLKPVPEEDCECATDTVSFFQTRSFLGIVTIFALLMLAFPSYAHLLYPTQEKEEAVGMVEKSHITQIEFQVNGMTCTGCEAHVEHAVNELTGILAVKASFEAANTIVKFDSTQTGLDEIIEAIKTTSYQVGSSRIID